MKNWVQFNFKKDKMPLPPPDRTVLVNAPLVVVLAQVRFDAQELAASPAAAEALLPAAEPLGLTAMTQVMQQQVTFTNGAAGDDPQGSGTQRAAGWQFASKDGSASLTLMPDVLTLEMRSYGSWDEFSKTWAAFVQALAVAVQPSLATRLGLRYVNRMTPQDAGTVAALGAPGLIDKPWLGPAVESSLAEYVTATEGRATLGFPDGTDALVQHGTVAESDGATFVLDIDCFRTRPARFSVHDVGVAFGALNDRALQIFQSVVDVPLRNQFTWGAQA